MEFIAMHNPQYSLLQIENILCTPHEFESGIHKECLHEFLEYIQDVIFGYFQAEHIDLKFDFLFLHGNIFQNKSILYQFNNLIESTLGYEIKTKLLHEI